MLAIFFVIYGKKYKTYIHETGRINTGVFASFKATFNWKHAEDQ